MKVLFDIETDGLLPVLSTIHSLVVKEVGKDNEWSCAEDTRYYTSVEEGLDILHDSDLIIGHNIISFDIPAIEQVTEMDLLCCNVYDTLNVSRLIYPNLRDLDFKLGMFKRKDLPYKLHGSHSLKAWGIRLGVLKGDFGETTDWSEWTVSMQDYCEQDVEVTETLYNLLDEKEYSTTAIELEIEFQKIIFKQEQEGVPFNEVKAKELGDDLLECRTKLKKKLQDIVGIRTIKTAFTPKRDNKTLGYKKDCDITKVKFEKFNPASGKQVVEYLKKEYTWNPVDFTDKGNPTVNGEVLAKLADIYPEVADIAAYLDVNKLYGMVVSGRNAWLKLVCDGRLHGYVNTNGALTGRCTHFKPNLAQVPSDRSFRGKECRSLFYAGSGTRMVGADAAGLELRCFAHYLYPYDHGAYREVILNKDIHTFNQEAAGLPTRDDAKTFIYAFLYGAGDAKLGSILEPHASEEVQRLLGGQARQRFMLGMPGLAQLLADIKFKFAMRGHLTGLDGRLLTPRAAHSAPNTLFQSAGAVIMKMATVILWKDLVKADLAKHTKQAMHVHDEYQLIVKEDYAEQVGEIAVDAIRKSGEFFKFNCPLDGKCKIGETWADTH